jgi:hypothetical protein
MERFTAQLEINIDDQWHPVVRYDNAHGFSHRDTLHPDGTQEKTRVFVGDTSTTFTFAVRDMRTNWQTHCSRYLGEMGK